MRKIVAALVLVAALGACSSDPDRYESAAAVAAAMRAEDISCEGYSTGEGAELLSDEGSCTSGDTEIGIYLFDDATDRDRWLQVGAGLDGIVVGPNWVVDASDQAEAVAEALGGEIR